jgi:hypothetical protein
VHLALFDAKLASSVRRACFATCPRLLGIASALSAALLRHDRRIGSVMPPSGAIGGMAAQHQGTCPHSTAAPRCAQGPGIVAGLPRSNLQTATHHFSGVMRARLLRSWLQAVRARHTTTAVKSPSIGNAKASNPTQAAGLGRPVVPHTAVGGVHCSPQTRYRVVVVAVDPDTHGAVAATSWDTEDLTAPAPVTGLNVRTGGAVPVAGRYCHQCYPDTVCTRHLRWRRPHMHRCCPAAGGA